ncbi:choice-of-anchor A family protein, partial [Enterococcus mundtii]|uniref:choice-of-anchor A family protein n=1 Tax=Enterococcus mundtii TaxID=53346 RepID=UPI000A549F1D
MFKNKVVNLSLMSVLLLHLFFPIQVIAETFLPQDPGSVYDDLTGDYGVLGIASQFHVFAKEKTTINAHTEGNVATGVLSATNNFGTSISTGDLNKEINYAQSVETIISSTETAASVKRSNKFIVGSNNVITTENDKIVVNGTRLDHLSVDEFYQDREDAQYIDFNKEFENLMLTSNMLMSLDPLKTYTPDDFPDMNNRVIDCTDLVGDQPYVINVAASVLAKNTPLRINNPEGKVLIMNVVDAPTSFSVQSQIQYNNRSNHQTEDFSDANISWNFGNLTEKLEINAPFQGTIIAPCADITVNQSQDGTIIGKNVILNATTNRWDPNEIFAVPNTHDDTTDTTSSSTEPSTSESSTEPSTSESSTEPSTSESSTEPSTSESSTEP